MTHDAIFKFEWALAITRGGNDYCQNEIYYLEEIFKKMLVNLRYNSLLQEVNKKRFTSCGKNGLVMM